MSQTAERNEGFKIYGGRDPRDAPEYPVEWAARLLLLPKTTLIAWVFGMKLGTKGGVPRFFEPLIEPPDPERRMLSFVNLVEVHVLKAVRRKHLVHMSKVRDVIIDLKRSYNTPHPLADVDLLAGGRDVFIQEHGALLNLTMGKQIAMDFLSLYLSRIERNLEGAAAKLFPYVVRPIRVGNRVMEQDSRIIAIDPYVSFGRPIINGTGIPTDSIADRFWGGDSIDVLVQEFNRPKIEIEYALRYENAQVAPPD